MEIVLLFGGFATFVMLNVPIAVAIGLGIVLYIAGGGTMSAQYMAQNMFTTNDSFTLLAIPFFVLAGALMDGGGLSNRLMKLSNSLIGHITGGLGMVTVLTCIFFGAISGSSTATVAAVGSIMIPAMVTQGYSKSFATALTAAAGALGVIIPPSIPMVMYGVATGASIGGMFLGGIGAGLVSGGVLMVVIYIISKKKGYKGTGEPFSLKKFFEAFNEAKWALLVPVIIMGGIYGGIFTPTEAAVVAVVYGFIVGKFVYKELDYSKVKTSLVDSSVMVGIILVVLGTGATLGKILTIEGVPDSIARWMIALTDNKYLLLILINLFLLVVGCVMETFTAILILGPILYPIMAQYDVNIIHFGVMMILNLAIGFITPPVGSNLFVACGITELRFEKLVKAIVPFLFALLIGLAFVTFFEDITMFLPKVFKF